MKRKLTKKDILKYLEEINKKLTERGKFGEIMICGGAVMTLVYYARHSTHDIDAVFKPKEDMKEIIDEIMRENSLNAQWLNDDVSMFTNEFKNLTSSEYKNFSNLTVNILDAESLLAMKLVSARENTYDLSDAVILMKHLNVTKVEELYALLEKYEFPLHPTALSESRLFARQAFNAYISHNMSFDNKKT
ncbi:MAG: DUF6036 family nucleotidyltransferase [Oscillospiraceae bacterium]|nr:DUF6036 family nucleotidyltransferase [Oscillospiraceae bacterium]